MTGTGPGVVFTGPSSVGRIGGREALGSGHSTDVVESTPAGSQGSWTAESNLNITRDRLNAVILPDGTILVLGGTNTQEDSHPTEPELYEDGEWRVMANSPSPCNYHSTAVLLPDGRVITGGGEHRTWDYAVFQPPYLTCGGTRPQNVTLNVTYDPAKWAHVLSGRDGRTLHRRSRPFDPSYPYQQYFWQWDKMGDVDGDGLPDYAVTLRDFGWLRLPNTVLVYSAVRQQPLWSVSGPWGTLFGEYIEGDLDLDGDGRPDLVVLAKRDGPLGRVYTYDSRGQPLYSVTAPNLLLRSLGKVGDVDGDGCDDFAIGALDAAGLGAALLVSGSTGTILRTAWGAQPLDRIGSSVAGVGDVDRDGIPDFASGSRDSGVFMVFSGATAQPLSTFRSSSANIGFSIARGGLDADQDGIPDFAVGAPHATNAPHGPTRIGRVSVFSGRDRRELFRIIPDPGQSFTNLGWTVANLGVQPGHPYPVIAYSESNHTTSLNPYVATRVRAVRTSHPATLPYGNGCSSTAVLPRMGAHGDGPSTRITLSEAPPGVPAFLALGLSDQRAFGQPLPLALDPLGFAGCRLLTSVEAVLVVATGTAGIDRGYASHLLPQALSTAGGDVFAQWFYLDPSTTAYGDGSSPDEAAVER